MINVGLDVMFPSFSVYLASSVNFFATMYALLPLLPLDPLVAIVSPDNDQREQDVPDLGERTVEHDERDILCVGDELIDAHQKILGREANAVLDVASCAIVVSHIDHNKILLSLGSAVLYPCG